MLISDTFLKSNVAKRIALLLFVAAVIPSSLMMGLSHKKINSLTNQYEHKSLINISRSYALSAFSRLTFARTALQQLSEKSHLGKKELLLLESGQHLIFKSIAETTIDNTLNCENCSPQRLTALSNSVFKENKHHTLPQLKIIPSVNANEEASVNLVTFYRHADRTKSLLVAELNPNFLWGKKEDYASDTTICAYQLKGSIKTKIFCSNGEDRHFDSNKSTSLNSGSWELFLQGEFDSEPWIFEINRINPLATKGIGDFIINNGYVGAAVLSLLIIGLLSLVQIRRTMIPLEQLIDGTRRAEKGDFTPVKINGKSEFSELSNAFNTMSANIKHQLDKLHILSSIDKKIASKLDMGVLISDVTARMQYLMPDASFHIFLLGQKTNTETECNVSIVNSASISSTKITIPTSEISYISTSTEGRFTDVSKDSHHLHERLIAEQGTNNAWVLPIIWAGEACAFLSVESTYLPDPNNKVWDEFRELANRIGIVISAQEREHKLLLQAQYDKLTGLPNRTLLQDRLKKAMENTDRTGNPLLLLFIDLDHFKYVNDSLGHSAGDELLNQIAKRLQASVRETDTVARFGGDEFVILTEGDSDENINLSTINRITDSINMPIKVMGQELVNTCSIGISIYPDDGTTAESLIKHADIAMYRAKELGKNNFQFFTQSMNKKAATRMHMYNQLRTAVDKNELYLQYQPKVDIATKKVVGMEALIRWKNPELGYVMPSTFIPMAEETGLIISIGEWVLETACLQTVAWQKAGFDQLLMSVNLSAKQFNHKDLIASIKKILDETGLNAKNLEIELTESAFMGNNDKGPKTLKRIKALGISLSVDDFGTGYSSLAYLNNLPLDTLKIDKTFIDDIRSAKEKVPIVNTIISLAKNLNLKVIAEGVESIEQVAYLEANGCDQIQGYYFSKPKSAKLIEAMLNKDEGSDLSSSNIVKFPKITSH